MIYLDSSATSLKPQKVLDKMNEYYMQYGVNIHRGVYTLSYQATEEYDKARMKVAKFINASFSEVVFTSNVTDALNKICLMLSPYLTKDDEIITTELEHHSSLLPWQNYATHNGNSLKYIPLNQDGRITVTNFKKVLTSKSKILAITYVSNVMGYITPIEEIIKIAHEHNMIVIVDAAQAVPHLRVDVKKMDCDFLAFSGHKMLGPTGVGVLYGKKNLLQTLKPIYYGGDMNEDVNLYSVDIKDIPYRFEAGTPMIAEAIGLGAAIDFIESLGFEEILKHEKELHQYALKELSKLSGITIYNKNADLGIISFNIDGVHPHDASSLFDERHICVRAGFHCAQLVSRWLQCGGTIRASIYVYNDYHDIDEFVRSVKDTITFFKQFSEVK